MHYYYISGTSSGIGRALALLLIERENTRVFGISRTCTIDHSNYIHIYADLSNPEQLVGVLELFNAAYTKDDSLYLINNAGSLDPIRYAGTYAETEIQRLIQINLLVPIQLINAFLKIPKDRFNTRVILSVSSGAATKVIDGWSLYGSTKAGLDHFSNHVGKELELTGDINTRIFSVAPGVVDTPMQQRIRETAVNSFSTVKRFLELKASNQLVAPEIIAEKYCRILDQPHFFSEIIFSLRDLN